MEPGELTDRAASLLASGQLDECVEFLTVQRQKAQEASQLEEAAHLSSFLGEWLGSGP